MILINNFNPLLGAVAPGRWWRGRGGGGGGGGGGG